MYDIQLSDDHKYTVNNKPFPGVSEIMETAALDDDRYYTEESRDRGTYVHTETEKMDRGIKPIIYVPEWTGYLTAWEKFVEDNSPQFLYIEHKMYNKKYGFCGTSDRYAILDKQEFILDIKSGAQCYAHGIQLGGYWILHGNKEANTAAVYLKPDGKYHIKRYDPRVYHWKFLHALGIWKSKAKLERKINEL